MPAPSTPYLFWAPTRMSGWSSNDDGLPHPPTGLHQSSFGMRIQRCSSHQWVGDICTSSSDDNRTPPPCIQAHFPQGSLLLFHPNLPGQKKSMEKTKDISLSNLYSQHFNCEQLVGGFLRHMQGYLKWKDSKNCQSIWNVWFKVKTENIQCVSKKKTHKLFTVEVLWIKVWKRNVLCFSIDFFVRGDLGEITIGNPVGLCGKCAWMHGGGVLLSLLDEVQMSPTRRWELHRWIRIPKDDWWRPVGGCGSPSSLEDHPDILVGAQNRYGVDGAGIHVCHPVKTTYNLTEIS